MQVRDHLALQTALKRKEVVWYNGGILRRKDVGPDALCAVSDVGFEVLDVLSQTDGGIPEVIKTY